MLVIAVKSRDKFDSKERTYPSLRIKPSSYQISQTTLTNRVIYELIPRYGISGPARPE